MNKIINRPKVIDLFAGAGGLSLGFEQAGFDVSAAVEIDPIHCAIHEYNFPNSMVICQDVSTLRGSHIRQKAQLGDYDIDAVIGGAPCQGFSMIGKRCLDDSRNTLVFHYVRLVSELQPKYCVFENVKGLTIGKQSKFLKELIDALEVAGYNVLLPYEVLNASEYGVPQNRYRLFLMAARKGLKMPKYPMALKNKITVWDAIGDIPDAENYEELLTDDCVHINWTTQSEYGKIMRGISIDPNNYGYERIFDRDLLTSSLRTEHKEASRKRFISAECGKVEKRSRFFKLDPQSQCNTLRAGTDSARGAFTSPRPIHPFLPRVITVREAARLHSFPDWFRFHKTKWHGFRQIGNSVPPFLARSVASEIMRAMQVVPSKPNIKLDLGKRHLLEFDMSAAAKYFSVSRNVIGQRTRRKNVVKV